MEARYLLAPRFMERVTALGERASGERGLSPAFDGSDLLIAIRSNKDHFEGGGIVSSFARRERAVRLLQEFSLLFEIIDVLELARKR